MKRIPILGGIIAVAIVVLSSSIFVVDERERALVLQFGQVRNVVEQPGLSWKLPFIQDVVKYDRRIQSLDTEPLEVTPADDRRLVVDAFARYRIVDVVQFRQAVGPGGIAAADVRLERVLNAALREVLGSVSAGEVLSADRVELMARIRDSAFSQAISLGVEVIDVRIKRADLPEQNMAATYARMQAEREREAADERARGREAAQRVRAQADRTAIETVSVAERESEVIRGQADAVRNRIFADAFGRDPEFFEFYRSMAAYERALIGETSTMVMSPDSEFFNYFSFAGGLGTDGAPVVIARPEPIEGDPDLIDLQIESQVDSLIESILEQTEIPMDPTGTIEPLEFELPDDTVVPDAPEIE